jgi:DNA modification methylase
MTTCEILNTDAVTGLRTLPAESVQCVVTSPPYWGLRDYGSKDQIGLEKSPDEFVAALVGVFTEIHRVLKPDGIAWLNLGDCYATGAGKVGDHPGGGKQGADWKGRGHPGKCAPGGGPAIYVGPMQQPNRLPIAGLKPKDLVGIPWRVAFAIQASGWWLRSDVIWSKANSMPESVTDRPTKSHEYIFLLTKSEQYYYDAEAVAEPQAEHERTRRLREQAAGLTTKFALRRDEPHGQVRPGENGCARSVEARQALAQKGTKNRRSVWHIPTQPYPEAHFATFTPEIPRLCILAGSKPGDTVLDPFGGSGTTGMVAQDLGRNSILIELNPAYCDLIRQRNRQPGMIF